MDLKTFIEETVKSIVNASKRLDKDLHRTVQISSHTNNRIDFDIAITTEEKEEKGIGIAKVFQAGINKENPSKSSLQN